MSWVPAEGFRRVQDSVVIDPLVVEDWRVRAMPS
jgi:hypothetical protein